MSVTNETNLLSLPSELLLEIGEILHGGDETAFEALKALRGTCRFLAELLNALVFSQLSINPATWDQKRCSEYCSTDLAQRVTSLKLHPICPEQHTLESISPCAHRQYPIQLLEVAKNATQLYLHCPAIYKGLFDVTQLHKLKSLTLSSSRLDILGVTSGEEQPIASNCLHGVIREQSHQLEYLSIYYFQLSLEAYQLIRDKLSSLKFLVFNRGLTLGLREEFGKATRWACARTLTSIVFNTCGGAHASLIASFVTRGSFSRLKECTILWCGNHSDDPNLPPPSHDEWNHALPCLDYLVIRNVYDWELKALSRIRTRRLHLTRVLDPGVEQWLSNPQAFGGTLEVLESSDETVCYDDKEENLRRIGLICAERNVTIVKVD